MLQEAEEALAQAEEVSDHQSIGVRCREVLIGFIHVAQDSIELPNAATAPKRSDFRAWSELLANLLLPGETHQERRGLMKSTAVEAWSFVNWLTHAKDSHIHDAESAVAITNLTLSLYTTAVIRLLREVPDACPNCGSKLTFMTAEQEQISRIPYTNGLSVTNAAGLGIR